MPQVRLRFQSVRFFGQKTEVSAQTALVSKSQILHHCIIGAASQCSQFLNIADTPLTSSPMACIALSALFFICLGFFFIILLPA